MKAERFFDIEAAKCGRLSPFWRSGFTPHSPELLWVRVYGKYLILESS